jgi:hypothetical protein
MFENDRFLHSHWQMSSSGLVHKPHMNFYFVEWAIALHGMYESALVFISILKQKNLYIVGCVQFDIWDITAYLLGGVGHCCTWHVQVSSVLIGSDPK